MAEYTAPLRDIRFVLEHLVDLASVTELPGFEHVDADGVYSVLEENARFMEDVIAPLNRVGDEQGSVRQADGSVTTPDGFAAAYQAYVDAGWNGVAFPPEYGGGGFPWLVGIAMQEILTSANMAFSMCPLLNQGAVDMLLHHASEEHKETYLPKMVTGEWTGTMNLTEPQAGSDVGALTTKAVPQDDGTYRITGTKIFISFGEHDMSQNIVHLVLARTPSAPPGTKGISCFIVPKHLLNDDGTLGARNDVTCVSIEHKMGIKASPTCVLSYGDAGEGAVGYLIGEENAGMRYMFTMMNNARLSVGLEGLSLAERAFQMALAYAKERRQGRAPARPRASSRRSSSTRTCGGCCSRRRPASRPCAGSSTPTPPPWTAPPATPTKPSAPVATSWPTSSRRCRRAGAPISGWSSRAWPSRSTGGWATSRRPASPSTTATLASPRSTRAPTASRPWTSSVASSRCAPGVPSATTSARSRPRSTPWRRLVTTSPRSTPA